MTMRRPLLRTNDGHIERMVSAYPRLRENNAL